MTKPDKKPNKKAAKPKNDVTKDEKDVKDATDDTMYQEFLTRGIAICRAMEAENLIGFWELGGVVKDFINAKVPGRDLEQFAVDLGIDSGLSTLYFARKINARYKRPMLPTMAARGIGITMLKICLVLKDDELAAVEKQFVKADGSLITTRELEAIVRTYTREAAGANAQRAIESTPTPARARAERSAESEAEAPETSGDEPEDISASGETPVDKAIKDIKPDDGKTGSRGATSPPEFSHSHLKAFRSVENAATKLTTAAADAIISATEVVKVGFDSPKAKDNARNALSAAHGAVKDLLKLLPDLEARLREALEDVQS